MRPARRRAARRRISWRPSTRSRPRPRRAPRRSSDALVAEAEAIWTAPHRRAAAVLGPDAAADARAAAALREAADELRGLAAADPALAGSPSELPRGARRRAGARAGVRGGGAGRRPARDPRAPLPRRLRLRPAGGRVPAPPDARAVPRRRRARRRSPAPAGSCSPATRTSSRASATCSTRRSRGPRRCSSSPSARPTRRATRRSRRRSSTTSARSSPTSCGRGAGGGCSARSRGRRRAAPTPHELRRARAAAEELPEPPPLGAPATEPVLRLLAARDTEAARGLENFAGCGVRWLVESVLRPERAEPDPEPMRRGSIAHAVLEQVLRRLGEREGSARLTPASLPAALEELDAAMADRARRGRRHARPRAPARARGRPAAAAAPRGRGGRRAGAALARVELRPRGRRARAAAAGGRRHGCHRPRRPDRRRRRRPRAGARLQGPHGQRRRALGARPPAPGRALHARRARAARARDGRRAVPAGRAPRRPRRAGWCATTCPARYVNGDVVDGETFDAALDEAREIAARAAADIHAGRVRACPDSCLPSGGCAYPGICRAGEGGRGPAA